MQATQIYLGSEDGDDTAPVTSAWVYWRVGTNTTILRTNRDGQLWAILTGATRSATRPLDYGAEFRAEFGSDGRVYYRGGARPFPAVILNEHDGFFFARKVNAKPPSGPHPWYERLLE